MYWQDPCCALSKLMSLVEHTSLNHWIQRLCDYMYVMYTMIMCFTPFFTFLYRYSYVFYTFFLLVSAVRYLCLNVLVKICETLFLCQIPPNTAAMGDVTTLLIGPGKTLY